MSRYPNKSKNNFNEVIKDGEVCIEFITGGKYEVRVTVDKKSWYEYLCNFYWTAQKYLGYLRVVTGGGKGIPLILSRMIVERENSELDYFGYTVDHKNNDPLDNRWCNLRLVHHLINSGNQKSKNKADNMQLIYASGNAYKIDTNVAGEKIYEYFKTKEEAIKYRDEKVLPKREAENIKLEKKIRDIEFERGLRNKIAKNEMVEVLEILRKYKVIEK